MEQWGRADNGRSGEKAGARQETKWGGRESRPAEVPTGFPSTLSPHGPVTIVGRGTKRATHSTQRHAWTTVKSRLHFHFPDPIPLGIAAIGSPRQAN